MTWIAVLRISWVLNKLSLIWKRRSRAVGLLNTESQKQQK